MNIQIEFVGFPMIYDIFPGGPHPYAFPGKTLSELIKHLIETNGQRLAESLLDKRTKIIDPSTQIMINKKFIEVDQIQAKEIKEGDHVTFLRLLAGG